MVIFCNGWRTIQNLQSLRRLLPPLQQTSIKTPNAQISASTNLFSDNRTVKSLSSQGKFEEALKILQHMYKNWVHVEHETHNHLLQQCANSKSVSATKLVHAHFIVSGNESDIFLRNGLIAAYGKCGSFEDARQVFDKMPERDVVSWTAMIAGYSQNQHLDDALQVFAEMLSSNARPNSWTFKAILRLCVERGKKDHHSESQLCVEKGKKDHHLESQCLSGQAGPSKKGKKGHHWESQCSSSQTWSPEDGGWTSKSLASSNGCTQARSHGFLLEKQVPYHQSKFPRLEPLSSVIEIGRLVHSLIMKIGGLIDTEVCNWLVEMYGTCCAIEDACRAFEEMEVRNAGSWNALIAGYEQQGMWEDVLKVFDEMCREHVKVDHVTFVNVLSACSALGFPSIAHQVHGCIIKRGFEDHVFVLSSLIAMYSKCGSMEYARQVFDGMSQRDAVLWTGMISKYGQIGDNIEALRVFREMVKSRVEIDNVTMAVVLSACCCPNSLLSGMEVHAHLIRSGRYLDVDIENELFDMYLKASSIDSARNVFARMQTTDVVLWNAIISSCYQRGKTHDVLDFYRSMVSAGVEPNHITYGCVLGACGGLERLEWGKAVHAAVLKSGFSDNLFACNCIISMYGKCRSAGDAQVMFQQLTSMDVVSWNTMIAAFDQNGWFEDSLKLFYHMMQSNAKPNEYTFISIISSCANLGVLDQGNQVFSSIIKTGFDSVISLGNALITMYAKCGVLADSRKIFDTMKHKNCVTWNAIISCYAQHGFGKDAIHLYETMQNIGVMPDEVTFVAVLFACSHAGLLKEGQRYFKTMKNDYGLSPKSEHYASMVDLICRGGDLNEAESFINEMPFKADALIWRTLLAACRVNRNLDIGQRAAKCLLDSDHLDASSYILLSNFFADCGRSTDRAYVMKLMRERSLKKEPGCTRIGVKNKLHTFVADDISHPQTPELYAMLEELSLQLKQEGYAMSDLNFALNEFEY